MLQAQQRELKGRFPSMLCTARQSKPTKANWPCVQSALVYQYLSLSPGANPHVTALCRYGGLSSQMILPGRQSDMMFPHSQAYSEKSVQNSHLCKDMKIQTFISLWNCCTQPSCSGKELFHPNVCSHFIENVTLHGCLASPKMRSCSFCHLST